MENNTIFLVSVPRSGSTWVGSVLASDKHTYMIYEPDNEIINLRARFFKRNLNLYPYLTEKHRSRDYYRLFKKAFNFPYPNSRIAYILYRLKQKIIYKTFKKRTIRLVSQNEGNKKNRLIKSVHCGLALEFLKSNFSFKPVILLRHPANIAASFLKMNILETKHDFFDNNKLIADHLVPYKLAAVDSLTKPLEKIGFQIGFLYYYFAMFKNNYSDTLIIKHDDLIDEPIKKFKALFADLKLVWSKEVESFIESTNKPGSGYQINRVISEERDKWKKSLTQQEVDEVRKGFHIMPQTFYKDF